ncbi:MAG: hypothetical protein EBS96_09110, partial [Spartobacteria bacterium]|nr:hypothetical protein [Spartobacteria bacterium]
VVRSSKTQSYEINKTLTNVIKNPGAITRISAAVFLSEKLNPETNAPVPRTPEQLNELRNMVVNALGITIPKNETATNYVSLQEVVFPSAVNSLSTPVDKVTGYMEMVRPIAALAIAAIVFAVLLPPSYLPFSFSCSAARNPRKFLSNWWMTQIWPQTPKHSPTPRIPNNFSLRAKALKYHPNSSTHSFARSPKMSVLRCVSGS